MDLKKPLLILAPFNMGKTRIVRVEKNIFSYKLVDADKNIIFEFDGDQQKIQKIQKYIYLVSIGRFEERINKYDCNFIFFLPENKEEYFERISRKKRFKKKNVYDKIKLYQQSWNYLEKHPNTIFVDKFIEKKDLIKALKLVGEL